MKRTVHIYRAEKGDKRTAPQNRRPIKTFAVTERGIDKALKLAKAETLASMGEVAASAHVLVNGDISIMLRARP